MNLSVPAWRMKTNKITTERKCCVDYNHWSFYSFLEFDKKNVIKLFVRSMNVTKSSASSNKGKAEMYHLNASNIIVKFLLLYLNCLFWVMWLILQSRSHVLQVCLIAYQDTYKQSVHSIPAFQPFSNQTMSDYHPPNTQLLF